MKDFNLLEHFLVPDSIVLVTVMNVTKDENRCFTEAEQIVSVRTFVFGKSISYLEIFYLSVVTVVAIIDSLHGQ